MKIMQILLVILCSLFIVGAQDWNRHSQLDHEGKCHLYWTVNGDIIVFQLEVATTGWVGFGISPNGGMAGSDIVIGWVANGTTTFHDRHAEGNFLPAIDERQDWELLWSDENATHTSLRFQRVLNTCDNEDREIMDHTTRVIYAFSQEDPVSDDKVTYHGPINRGSKSLNLLEKRNDNQDLGASEDLLYWEIRSPNVTIPGSVDTSYLCTVVKRPQLDRLHHIIKAEAIIQPGNERLLHHMLLYECTDGNETQIEPFLSGYHECYTEDQIPKFSFCFTVMIVWAVGGETLYLPERTGFPLGRSNAVYYVLEVHYDNPGYKSGIADNSGLRITYTPKLRKYDSGILGVGNLWYGCIFIPPRQKDFVVAGHAHPECLRQALPPDGINVFAVLLHSHLAGRKIKVRHFRGGKELPPIRADDTYDFNYQNFVMLSEEKKILPNDHIIVECSYDTSREKRTTFGGLSTREEMCAAFLMYYPDTTLSLSVSCPAPINLVKVLGVTEMSDDDRFLISSISGKNESYRDFLNSYPWDDNSVNAIQRVMKYSPQLNMCSEKGGKFKLIFTLSTYPKVKKAYSESDKCAGRNI